VTSLVKLSAWARSEEGRPAVADLAWTRLSVWQELSARFFDPPEMRAHAGGVTRLALKQASDKGARLGAEGALFLGWMATRLGWKISRLGGALRFRRPDGGQVALALSAIARPAAVAPGSLTYVGVVAESGGVVANGAIERSLASGLPGETADADVLSWKLDVPLPAATQQRVRPPHQQGGRAPDRHPPPTGARPRAGRGHRVRRATIGGRPRLHLISRMEHR